MTPAYTTTDSQQRPELLHRGFTLIELLVVISIIALLVAILLPALGAIQRVVRQTEAQSQARNLQTGMVVFAQDNNSWYPGLSSQGTADPSLFVRGGYVGQTNETSVIELEAQLSGLSLDETPEWWADAIVWTLLNKGSVTPDAVISPAERGKEPWDGSYTDTTVGDFFDLRTSAEGPAHSYAYLDPRLGDEHPVVINDNPTNRVRIRNWRDNSGSLVPVISDRILTARTSEPAEFDYTSPGDYNAFAAETGSSPDPRGGVSIHQLNSGSRDTATWQGVVVMNDGSASFRDRILPATQLSETFAVKQNDNRTGDDIFFPWSEDEAGDERNDAVMLYADTN
ncbi:type II secretion system protein [Mucisphaera sp.]|uniref:type II secretion system protein n=1 Tax=Mucisphaera sp. TaxID=2913024 RepID=UPI003D0B9077